MIRLLGILSGSALAVALLVVTLGIPDVATKERDEILPPTPAITPPAAAKQEPAAVPEVQEEPVAVPVAAEATPQEDTTPAPAVPDVSEVPDPPDVPTIGEEHWYTFWSPFNSRIAAEGFVAQLQRTTGLDYRVVKLKPGVYEVAFAYSDETDIDNKLVQISSATGLEIPGS